MKEFDTFLARVQARRAWLEQVAANCRARMRRERQETERMQTRRIVAGTLIAALWIVAGAALVGNGLSEKLMQTQAEIAVLEERSEQLAEENERLLSELWRLDELMEQGNRDGMEEYAEDIAEDAGEFDAAKDARGLYVVERTIYDAPAWYGAGEFRIYHYCPCEKCTGKAPGAKGYGVTATGTTATAGRTVSVDPSVIPLGSEVLIGDQIYIAEDTGVSGRCIDIFVNDHAEALRLGTYTTAVWWR